MEQAVLKGKSKIEAFRGLTFLDEYVAIYVPSTSNVIEATDSAEMVNYVISELTRLFGGTTTTQGRGSYMSDEHGVVIEDVTIVRANMCTLEEIEAKMVVRIAKDVKRLMSQECVSVEYNGTLMFV